MPTQRSCRLLLHLSLPLALFALPVLAAEPAFPHETGIYEGWLKMYDLQFAAAHQVFAQWQRDHPTDPLGPASDAAAYLFSELARLGSLEAELFVDDSRFISRSKLQPDPAMKTRFDTEIDEANRLADADLQKSDRDANALFVKSLVCGLRADYAGLIDKRDLAALIYTNQGRPYAEKLLAVDPTAFDAHLGPGVENYLLSFKTAPLRFVLRLTGSKVDRAAGVQHLEAASLHGYYLEPFAKLLLAVVALRNNDPERASELLGGLHDRFPDNQLFVRELNRIHVPPSSTDAATPEAAVSK
ncbi:MAG TPA: hypothetical protein VGI85_10325 [Chthoniobacterales bacterium]